MAEMNMQNFIMPEEFNIGVIGQIMYEANAGLISDINQTTYDQMPFTTTGNKVTWAERTIIPETFTATAVDNDANTLTFADLGSLKVGALGSAKTSTGIYVAGKIKITAINTSTKVVTYEKYGTSAEPTYAIGNIFTFSIPTDEKFTQTRETRLIAPTEKVNYLQRYSHSYSITKNAMHQKAKYPNPDTGFPMGSIEDQRVIAMMDFITDMRETLWRGEAVGITTDNDIGTTAGIDVLSNGCDTTDGSGASITLAMFNKASAQLALNLKHGQTLRPGFNIYCNPVQAEKLASLAVTTANLGTAVSANRDYNNTTVGNQVQYIQCANGSRLTIKYDDYCPADEMWILNPKRINWSWQEPMKEDQITPKYMNNSDGYAYSLLGTSTLHMANAVESTYKITNLAV